MKRALLIISLILAVPAEADEYIPLDAYTSAALVHFFKGAGADFYYGKGPVEAQDQYRAQIECSHLEGKLSHPATLECFVRAATGFSRNPAVPARVLLPKLEFILAKALVDGREPFSYVTGIGIAAVGGSIFCLDGIPDPNYSSSCGIHPPVVPR